VDAIPDIFKTVLNVTADLSVAAIAARWVTPGGGEGAGRGAP
jgi:hypothetical protein